jgi:NAD(P)-dependent dehydrogenase (short-subunit alcohol dehydrogenase family)
MTRTAIVTGASQGIGRAIVERLVDDGYNVVGCARTPGATASALRDFEDRAVGVDADVTRAEDVQRVIDTAISRFGGVDVLVNNAGVYQRRGVLEITEAEWTETMSINVTGVLLFAQAAARAMIATGSAARGGGRIVNIASVAGILSETESAPYNASKAAVISLTRSLATDLAAHGIASTCVAPGWVDTAIDPILATLTPEQLGRLNPQGRVGTPAEVAHAVAALCDPRAGYMNGAIVTVDGGQTAASPNPV